MSSPSASEGPPPPTSRRSSRFSKRNKLKNGTFILPSTGERVRRQITLRNPANFERPVHQNSNYPSDFPPTPRRTYSQAGNFRTAVENTTALSKEFWQWLHTPTAKGILKCSLAYLLGSMGTFLPPLAHYLGHQDGKHMVATITVYFHPARSAGSMIEAVMLGFAAFVYATFISISSMAVSVFFATQLDLIGVAYALVLIVFCGGGFGLIGWIKQKFNTPLVSVACSTASLAMVTALTKENAVHVGVFEDDKIVQVMKMVIMGMAASAAVSLLVWPVSSRTELRETMIQTMDSLGSMLTLITRGFLSGSESDLRSSSFNSAQRKYRAVFKTLTKNLREAKFEHYVLGTEDQYKLQSNLVDCMQRLAQSIGGLRSAATTQFQLLRETADHESSTPVNWGHFSMPQMHGGSMSAAKHDRFAILTAIEEASEEGSGTDDQRSEDGGTVRKKNGSDTEPASNASTAMPIVRTPAEIFSRFIMHLGPSMKSLAYTLSRILQELPFGPGPEYPITINEHFQTSLTEALKLYSGARSEALKELYKLKDLDRDRPESIEADFEEVAASCGHFSFSLLSFAEEMQTYMTILEELKEEVDNRKQRSWNWVRFWRKDRHSKDKSENPDPEQEALIEQNRETDAPRDLPEIAFQRRQSKTYPGSDDGCESAKQGFYTWVLQIVRFLERDDIRFAIKVGIGAALWALFAFIPATRPYYRLWRGEWGLVSFMLVCSMTIGASNTTGYARFIGTFVGAISSLLVWWACHANPFALAFCGWLFAVPCFYLIVAKGKGPLGRFTILTYNLSCLYAYSLSVQDGADDDDEGGTRPIITEIALHRVVAVIGGVIWGLIISRMIWPISARHKFKDGLSLLWLRMGLIWKRDPLSTLTEGESTNAYMNLREEFALHRFVLRLDGLRASAAGEFELRGPFPTKAYGRIMESTTKLLDAFHAMNVIISDSEASEGEKALLKYTANERAELSSRISHLFQVLASSLKLEYPMNDATPSADSPRDRLLAKIFQYRKLVATSEDPSLVIAKDADYEVLYAYVLVTSQLAEEIKKAEKEVEDLFGVMDDDLLKLQ